MLRRLLTLAAGAAVLALSSAASAADKFESMYEGHRIGLAMDIWPSTAGSGFLITNYTLHAQIAPVEFFAIDVEFPSWSLGVAEPGGFASFGNIGVGGHGIFHVDKNVAVWGGLFFSFPTRWEFGSDLLQLAWELESSQTRAAFDLHRTTPMLMTLKFPLGVEARFIDLVYLRGGLAIPIYFPVGDFSDFADTAVVMEQYVEGEFRAPFGLGGGLRLQLALSLTETSDHAQFAMVPFVNFEPPGRPGFFARLGFMTALDTPAGFAFDEGKLFAFLLDFGGKF